MASITEDEVMSVIARIERGEWTVVPDYDWVVVWTNRTFKTADGCGKITWLRNGTRV
jgi:hypothetical protein